MNWTKVIIELLPYIVAMVGIVTLMVMLGVFEEVLRNS